MSHDHKRYPTAVDVLKWTARRNQISVHKGPLQCLLLSMLSEVLNMGYDLVLRKMPETHRLEGF
jgi:hypothetical protein